MPKLSDTRLTRDVADKAKPGDCISDATQRGFRLVVSAAGTKHFVIAYRVAGRSNTMRIGRYPEVSVEDARVVAANRLNAVRQTGIDPVEARKARDAATKAQRQAPTVADLADEYLGSYASSRDLSKSTLEGARVALRLALPTMGRMRVADVTIGDVRKAHGDAKAAGLAAAKARAVDLGRKAGAAEVEGDTRRAATLRGLEERALARIAKRAGVYQANRLLAVLSKMFALAIERGWRTDNPCNGVAKFPEDQRWRRLDAAEVGRLLDACDAYEIDRAMEPQARASADAIRLLLLTGARLREVLKAEWGQFNLEAGLWEKPSSHTKAKRQHHLEIDGEALDLLRGMKERATHGRYVFPGRAKAPQGAASSAGIVTPHPARIAPRVDLKRPWRDIAARAGLEDVRLHDIRRTTASFMLDGGSSLATVGKALGHTQAATTARYAILGQSVQREELRKAGAAMAGLRGRAKVASNVTPLR